MNKIVLHVCLTGFHQEKNYSNIRDLFLRLDSFNDEIEIKKYILYKTNENEGLRHLLLPLNLEERLVADSCENFELIGYESNFLKSGGVHVPHTPTTLTIQHEPLSHFLSGDISDNDYVLKTRTDVHISDEFIDQFTSVNFYESLKTVPSEHTVFETKIWNALIGPGNVFEFTDYFFLARAKELRLTLLSDHKDSCRIWSHPLMNSDHPPFAEKIQHIKPLLPHLEKYNITNVNSEYYWEIVNHNFHVAAVGEGNDPRRPVLDRNRK